MLITQGHFFQMAKGPIGYVLSSFIANFQLQDYTRTFFPDGQKSHWLCAQLFHRQFLITRILKSIILKKPLSNQLLDVLVHHSKCYFLLSIFLYLQRWREFRLLGLLFIKYQIPQDAIISLLKMITLSNLSNTVDLLKICTRSRLQISSSSPQMFGLLQKTILYIYRQHMQSDLEKKLKNSKKFNFAHFPFQNSYCFVPAQLQVTSKDYNGNFQHPKITIFFQSRGEQTVHIKQRRVSVQKTLQRPYQWIGLIQAIDSQQKIVVGTGSLIGKNIVLTAAHVVYDISKQNIRFHLASNGIIDSPFQIMNPPYFPEQYKDSKGKDKQYQKYDYAILELKENIGQIYGYFGVDFGGISSKEKEIYEIAGYPEQYMKQKNQKHVEASLYKQSGYPSKKLLEQNKLQYSINTSRGQSGCPIFKEEQGEYTIVGIHTSGKQDYNQGVQLNKDMQKRINKWLSKTGWQIDLSQMEIQDKTLKYIVQKEGNIEDAQKLNLNTNNISFSEPFDETHIQRLSKIRILHLQNNKISKMDFLASFLARLQELTELWLNENGIDPEGADKLASSKIKNLAILSLSKTRVGRLGGEKIILSKELINLRKLYLERNNLQPSDKQKLQHLIKGEKKKVNLLIDLKKEFN